MPPIVNPDDILPHEMSSGHPHRGQRSGYPPPPSPESPELRAALPTDPISISVARSRVRRWLASWSWPTNELDDIVLAVSEAVSNAIEHAYLHQPPGLVHIRGQIEPTPGGQRQVMIVVRDHGRWRPPPRDDENRRRGIPLMRICMESVTIDQPDDNPVGTRVVLRSKPVPPVEQTSH